MSTPSTTLRHVVLFAFNDDAGTEQIDAVVAGFLALPQAIPGILGQEWGRDVGPEGLNDGFTHTFTLSFASLEDRNAFVHHPAHEQLVSAAGAIVERSLVLTYWAQ